MKPSLIVKRANVCRTEGKHVAVGAEDWAMG